ncbi:hypothetical protein [Solidesulfovibrio alcoholivorans]|uniref:hypothetical protein n=1 Tax=Solidesulfovibrio alcoholivorans TaxID=81406 RepID=UPI000494EFC8|nr:hypothetical protein [Solidesulfovibrio alcoholivorans]
MAISFDEFKRKKEAAEAAVNESIKEKFVAAAQKLKSLEASKKRGSTPQQVTPQGNAQTSNFDDADDDPEDPFDTILRDLDLFTDPNGIGYATINFENIYRTYKIGETGLKKQIKGSYFDLTGRLPKERELKTFCDKIEYLSERQGITKEVYVRFAHVDDEIYIDLGDKSGRAVHITSSGWQVVTNPPVKFIRYGHMLPLPVPLHNGDYRKLLKFLNLKTKDDELLVLTWPLVAAISSISHAPLILHGAPGACKSGSISALRGLLDPSAPMHTYVQKKVDDAALYIEQNAIPAFDNLTTITKDVENVMCLAATTGSIAKRRLHKNDELVTYKLNRAMLITALELPTSAPDFLDRAIVVALDRVTPDTRRPESQIKREYAQDLPGILGGMCDHLSKMLGLYGKVTPPSNLPRMADHATWACVAALALGYSQDDFIKAHKRAALRAQQNAFEDDDFATVLVDFLNSTGEVEGYVSEVLDALREYASRRGIGRGVLPKIANVFSRRLKEITKYLELADWQCEFSRSAKIGRVLTFTRLSPAEPDVDQEIDLAPASEHMPADFPLTLDRDEWSQAFEADAGDIDGAAENSAPLLTQP